MDASLGTLFAATILWATLAIEKSDRAQELVCVRIVVGPRTNDKCNAHRAASAASRLARISPLARQRGKRVKDNRVRTRIELPSIALVVAMLCCVPWTIRNYEAFHRFVPFRSVLGLQLWLGNNPNAQETWMGQLHPIFDSAERARYIKLGEIDYMQQKQGEAIEYMRSHPQREAVLIWSRIVATWSGGTPHPVADFIHTPSLWFRGVLLFNLLMALGAAAGIFTLYKRRSEYTFPVAAAPIVIPWAYYLTLAYPRYRLPVDPAVMILATVALAQLVRAREILAGQKARAKITPTPLRAAGATRSVRASNHTWRPVHRNIPPCAFNFHRPAAASLPTGAFSRRIFMNSRIHAG